MKSVLVAISGMFLSTAKADTIVVPNANASIPGPGAGLSRPFSQQNTRWQQIYMSPEFNAANGDVIQITKLSFRIDEMTSFSSFSTIVSGLGISMSTTDRNLNTASLVFADNYSAQPFEALPITDLPLNGTRSSATSFDVVIPLPNAYTYDRRYGNLLVDFRVVGGGQVPFLDQQGGLPDSTFSIFGTVDVATGTTETSQGLVTQFTYVAVPEPKPIWLLFVACCALITKKRVRS